MSLFDADEFLKNLTQQPGIYRMYGQDGTLIYVGKAKNLKNRVSQYFQNTQKSRKTEALVKQIASIEITVTQSEHEALILESNTIKKFKPRYNVLLRDDKSYPYIMLSIQHDFPRIDIYRGKKMPKGKFYGPFPSGLAVRESINFLQKMFKIRQCSDNFFNARTRPCLQYQIKRCTAPCVGYIDQESYKENIRNAQLFLEGRNQDIIDALVLKMEKLSELRAFEQAARIRDQIIALRKVQQDQVVSKEQGDIDVIAVVTESKVACLSVLTIRAGRMIGSKSFFPKMELEEETDTILEAFISQYYSNQAHSQNTPALIITNVPVNDAPFLCELLGESRKKKVKMVWNVRGDKTKLQTLAVNNANVSLRSHLSASSTAYKRFEALQHALDLPTMPLRVECFDISHTQGESTVASCVVFTAEGPKNADYRRYNISGITPGDDYAAMRQVLMRRYEKMKIGEAVLPDVIFIDGGKGQLSQAIEVMESLQITDVLLVGIAKGEGRKPGLETLYTQYNKEGIHLPVDDIAFLLIQQVRDEAHRFAITGHRAQRDKKRKQSTLDDIPGIGAKRRKSLLQHFGGLQGIQSATVDELITVPGISRAIAIAIHDALHDE